MRDGDASGPTGAMCSRVGLVVALVSLGIVGGGRLASGSLWVDEAWSLGAFRHLRMSFDVSGGSMLGYYLLMWPLARISQEMWWLRAPSLLAGLATLVVVHRIGRVVSGRLVAALAPLLLVASPMFLWKATEVRAYGIETFVAALCWLAFVTSVAEPRARWPRPLLIVGALAGPWMHGLFPLQLAGIVVAAAAVRDRRTSRWAVVALVVGSAGALVARALHGEDVGARVLGDLGTSFGALSVGFLSPNRMVALVLGAAAAVGLVAAAPARLGTGALRGSLVPATWVVVPLFGALVVRRVDWVFDPRYLAPCTPGLALLIAMGLRSSGALVGRRWHSRPGLVRRLSLVPALLVVLIAAGGQIASPPGVAEGWRDAADLVAARAEPGDAIVFVGGFTHSTTADRAAFEAAWSAEHRSVVPRSISPARPLGDVRRVDTYLGGPAIRRAAARHRRVWYVDYHSLLDLGLNPGGTAVPAGYRKVVDRSFAGHVAVYRFDRSTSVSRPEGAG